MIDTLAKPQPTNGKPVAPPRGSAAAAQALNTPFPLGDRFFYGSVGFMPLGPGGSVLNPLGLPYWPNYLPSSTWVYDWMLRHPRIQQVRSIVFNPIISTPWAWECNDGLNDKMKLVKAKWDAIRPAFICDALRGIDYGCAKFEPEWESDGGFWYVKKMKPLDVDRTGIWSDYGGNFTGFSVGLRSDLTDDEKQKLGIPLNGLNLPAYNGKAWLYTYDGKNGYLHGRSRLENLRETAWIPWLTTLQQIILLGGKVSGRQAYGMVPPGGYLDPASGQNRTYVQDMQDAMLAFVEGKNPIFTNLSAESQDENGYVDPVLKAKLASAMGSSFGLLDFGNNGPAIASLQTALLHYEDLVFAGYLQSSRTGMQSENGSRADSEQHTDTGLLDPQCVGDGIAGQLQPLVDFQCLLDFGLPAGSIRVKQGQLVDREAMAANALMNSMCQSNQDIALALSRVIDFQKNLEAQRIQTLPGKTMQGELDAISKERAANAQKIQPDAKPTNEPDVQPPADKPDKGVALSRETAAALETIAAYL